MYIGDTGESGLHHMLWELITNSAAEAAFGGCRNISVELLADGGCQVRDDRRGIPRKQWKSSPSFATTGRTAFARTSHVGLAAVVSLQLESPQ